MCYPALIVHFLITMDYRLSWAIMDYRELSWIIVDYNGLWTGGSSWIVWIVMDYGPAWIIVD